MSNVVELPLTSAATTKRETFYLDVEEVICAESEAPQAYVASIAKLGQLVPILVTAHPDGSYEVTEGCRRVAAIKEINRRQLPGDDPLKVLCTVTPCEVGEEPFVTLSANLVRSRNAPVEANAVMALVDQGKKTKEIAKDLGVSARYIQDLYELRRGMDAKAWAAFAGGKMALSTAKRMLTLDKKVQRDIVRENPKKVTGKAVNASRKDQYLDMMDQLPSVTPEASTWEYDLLANKLQMIAEDCDVNIPKDAHPSFKVVIEALRAL